jgi:hypothetical protein
MPRISSVSPSTTPAWPIRSAADISGVIARNIPSASKALCIGPPVTAVDHPPDAAAALMIGHLAEIEPVEKADAIAPISPYAGYHRLRFAQERHELA